MAVGSYRRQEEIGRGSFATVYKASMTVSDSTVSLIVSQSYSKVLILTIAPQRDGTTIADIWFSSKTLSRLC